MNDDNVNEAYFDTWHPNMAYLCGFIYGDGCIWEYETKSGRRLVLRIAIRDLDLLEAIRQELAPGKRICICNDRGKPKYQLDIVSVKMCERLISLGIKPRKSSCNDTLIVDTVPDEYFSHFVRGLVDADGNIRLTYKRLIEVRISGKRTVLERIGERLVSLGIVSKYNITPLKNTKPENVLMSFTGEDSACLCDYMYRDAGLYLERKKTVYSTARKVLFKQHRYRVPEAEREAILQNYMSGMGWKKAFKSVGRHFCGWEMQRLRALVVDQEEAQVQ